MKEIVNAALNVHKDVLEKVMETLQDDIRSACQMAVSVLQSGGKIMFCGNGGSAADAQHLAAEISGRFETERRGLPALALTTDSSVMTAVSNDYGYEHVFRRQVEALANSGDLLVGISTSGNSASVMAAFEEARKTGCKTIGLSGKNGGAFSGKCDLNIVVPSPSTARIQEMHILIGHIICKAVDTAFEETPKGE